MIMQLYELPEFCAWGNYLRYSSFISRTFDTWGIQYNHSGKLLFGYNGSTPKIYEGSYVFFNSPGPVLTYGSVPGENRHHSYVTIRGERVKYYQETGFFKYDEPMRIHDSALFLRTFQELHLALWQKRMQKAVNLLDNLFFQLEEADEIERAAHETVYYHQLQNLIRAIELNPTEKWNFEHEAKKIGISYPQFRRLFRTHFKMPPHQFLMNCRFLFCADMISETDLQIREIAAMCGFEDLSFFAKQFKQRYSLTPLKYRQFKIISAKNQR